ncbi:MAG: pseudouridine synthase [Rhizobiaceae bacterium]|nr:pseudouridine synthase [Rhizobiaceae bacterium]
MTMNDKPKRPGSKPFTRDAKPKSAGKHDDAKQAKPAKAKAAPAKVAAGDEGGDGKAERISKVMARAGVASRRDIERMIMEGRVKLNGVTLETPVVNVTLTDKIEVDGVPIRGIERTRLWLYHKPSGLVTTNADPEGRPTVFDNLPEELPRVMSIGRLDINTEGLLLLTNDGGLARVLELPTTGWLRRYRVRAHGEIDQEALDKLKEGIAVDGVLYGSIEATLDRTQGSNVWITMGLREGKNREIKNVLGALGLEVNRLIRISYGPFQLGELPEGRVLEVRGRTLRDQLGPRLVEDAKANFDAPLYNAPAVAAEDEEDAKPQRAAAPARGAEKSERPRRERPEDKRERALSRLDTKRDDRHDDDRPKRQPLGNRRNANVWMAPGARPLGEKAAAKAAKNVKTATRRGEVERPQRSSFDRPDAGPRVRVNRVDEADGEWIRSSEEAPRRSRDGDEGSERKRSFGDRQDRGDRPRGDRPFSDRPRGDRPFSDRPRGDRPSGDRPRSDRPRGERSEGGDRPRTKSFSGESRSERPRGERPQGDRAFRDRPYGDRPRGDRPFGDKPRGDRRPRAEGDERPRARSFDGEQRSERPRGDRPVGDRPRGDRPYGDRSRSERPAGDRPQGERSFGDRPAGKSFGKPGGAKSFGGKPGGKPGASGFGKPRGEGRPAGGPGRGGPSRSGPARGGPSRGGPGRGGPKGGRG